MKNKIWMVCGMLAALVYVFAVILGGILFPAYSHIHQPVSDLIGEGAPTKALIDPLFVVYNLLTIGLGIGLFQVVLKDLGNRRRSIGWWGALLLVAEGVFGILDLVFSEGAGGVSGMSAGLSLTGTLHIVFAMLCSLSTMLTMVFMGLWFRGSPRLKGYGLYSFVSTAVVFISGGLAAATMSNPAGLGGLLERITMGGFLQWIFVIGLTMAALFKDQLAAMAVTEAG